MGIVLGNLQGRFSFLRTTNMRMNLVMKDLTTTTMTGEWVSEFDKEEPGRQRS